MLAMIQINLLPQEYRPAEGTNFPLVAALVVGLAALSLTGGYAMVLNDELTTLEREETELVEKKTQLETKGKEVDEAKAEIARHTSRQDAIIKISQSKVMWSLKLDQFARIVGSERFSGFWITSLQLTDARGRQGSLNMQVSAIGRDLNDVSAFRDALKDDANFFYHFTDLNAPSVQTQTLSPGQYLNATSTMSFRMTLPVRQFQAQETGRGGRR